MPIPKFKCENFCQTQSMLHLSSSFISAQQEEEDEEEEEQQEPSPKYSQKGLFKGFKILHAALSYQKNKILIPLLHPPL